MWSEKLYLYAFIKNQLHLIMISKWILVQKVIKKLAKKNYYLWI